MRRLFFNEQGRMKNEKLHKTATPIRTAKPMTKTMKRMAREIVDNNSDIQALVLLGILRRGRPLADRLARLIGDITGIVPPVGSLATTLYRDDFRGALDPSKVRGQTHFDFNVDDRTVVLVDDVLAAGRTIRAAMDEVMDYGRPSRIQLACLIDRGHRELPIRADYLGWSVETDADDWVSVHLKELDGEDVVLLETRTAQSSGGGA
jgi:pyrimidine operon attenuation protein/uracil phosphoribosyltransferase